MSSRGRTRPWPAAAALGQGDDVACPAQADDRLLDGFGQAHPPGDEPGTHRDPSDAQVGLLHRGNPGRLRRDGASEVLEQPRGQGQPTGIDLRPLLPRRLGRGGVTGSVLQVAEDLVVGRVHQVVGREGHQCLEERPRPLQVAPVEGQTGEALEGVAPQIGLLDGFLEQKLGLLDPARFDQGVPVGQVVPRDGSALAAGGVEDGEGGVVFRPAQENVGENRGREASVVAEGQGIPGHRFGVFLVSLAEQDEPGQQAHCRRAQRARRGRPLRARRGRGRAGAAKWRGPAGTRRTGTRQKVGSSG